MFPKRTELPPYLDPALINQLNCESVFRSVHSKELNNTSERYCSALKVKWVKRQLIH